MTLGGAGAKGLFFLNLSVLGGLATLAMSQVPQPWRGIVVLWLVFALTGGVFVLRLVRHHYEYKEQQLTATKKAHSRARTSRRQPRTSGALKVVQTDRRGVGRKVL